MPVLIMTPLMTADMRRRGWVGLGKPDVQGHEACLGAEADKAQDKQKAA